MFNTRCWILTTIAMSLFLVGFNVILYQKQPSPSSNNKRQHRSFNLLEDVGHPPTAADLGEECTLGNYIILLIYQIVFRVEFSLQIMIYKIWEKDYMNEHRLQQDHPCVIETIRRDFLKQPASEKEPLILREPNRIDSSVGQSKAILRHLNNKVILQLFFIKSKLNSNLLRPLDGRILH